MATDPSALLQAVIQTQADEPSTSALSAALRDHPAWLSQFAVTLLSFLSNASAAPRLCLWILDAIYKQALSSPALSLDEKTRLSERGLDPLVALLKDSNHLFKKSATEAFASAYPFLFRYTCQNPQPAFWDKVVAAKNIVLNSWTTSNHIGVRTAATKLVQKVIQTQTRGNADPRMQHRAEPNLAMCPSNHPHLNAQSLEDEAKRLLDECCKTLYISNIPDVISAIVNIFTQLVKARPFFANQIIVSLANWEPKALTETRPSSSSQASTPLRIRSVEKTFRIALAHLLRTGQATTFAPIITEFLHKQNVRMLSAAEDSRRRREDEATRKRARITDSIQSPATEEGNAAKKRKLDIPTGGASKSFAAAAAAGSNTNEANPLASFDVTTLPVTLVTELIIANLQVVTDGTLAAAIMNIRKHLPVQAALTAKSEKEQRRAINPIVDENEELTIQVEEEEEELSADALAALEEFELPLPDSRTDNIATNEIILSTLSRICADAGTSNMGSPELGQALVSRLVAKGLNQAENKLELKAVLVQVFLANAVDSLALAQNWLFEEWSQQKEHKDPQFEEVYERSLSSLIDGLLSPEEKPSDSETRRISAFLQDLPVIPPSLFPRLQILCQTPAHLALGFTTLRDLVLFRATYRSQALDILLSLSTHIDKPTRNAAIVTLKRWVPEMASLADTVLQFASQLLERLETSDAAKTEEEAGEAKMEIDDEEGEQKARAETIVKDGQYVSGLPEPKTEQSITQHIELLLALCVKVPDLLDRLFVSYSRMPVSTQQMVDKLITMLVRSLGPRHPKILSLIRDSPSGSQNLVLRVLAIFSEKGKTAPALVELIKSMAAEKELNPRFMIPIVSELDKAESIRLLPRLLSLVGGSAEDKLLVRSVIDNILSQPISSYESGSRAKETITPVEFLVLVHQQEKVIGIKNTVEVVNMCLGMPDTFGSDKFGAFMQQMVDEPVLPTLYLRTVIQAVTTFKQLQQYVSSSLLSRLITKKIWTTPTLWAGFILCAKTLAPHSFGALLQLPKEQLREVVQKQPSLQAPLIEHVSTKLGGNRSRMLSLMEVLGGDVKEEAYASPSPASEAL